jgi:hypothetical protein
MIPRSRRQGNLRSKSLDEIPCNLQYFLRCRIIHLSSPDQMLLSMGLWFSATPNNFPRSVHSPISDSHHDFLQVRIPSYPFYFSFAPLVSLNAALLCIILAFSCSFFSLEGIFHTLPPSKLAILTSFPYCAPSFGSPRASYFTLLQNRLLRGPGYAVCATGR